LRCEKVLTGAAKHLITKDFESGMHKGKEGRREPPFMAPSLNPDDYSIVSAIVLSFSSPLLTIYSGAQFAKIMAHTFSFVPDVGSPSVQQTPTWHQDA
jgi:hypothetical protein